MFTYIENVLPTELAERIFSNHSEVKSTDLSSHERWNYTDWNSQNKILPEVFLEQLPSSVILEITNHLFSNQNSPFYGDKLIKNTDALVLKYLPGSVLPMHRDNTGYTFTIFLNKEWTAEDGGQFVWQDEDTNILNVVQPKFNCGVYYKNTSGKKCPYHGVPANLSQKNRIALQLFIMENRWRMV